MRPSKNGSAIVIVLIISAVSIAMALFAIQVSRNLLYSTEMLKDKLSAELQAESTVEKLKYFISTGRFKGFTVENLQPPPLCPEKLYIDGRENKIGKKTTVFLKDTGGKINVWAIRTSSLIASYLEKIGAVDDRKASVIRDSLRDWVDKDDLKHLNGAEKYYYHDVLGVRYGPRNFPGVQSIEELHLIRGLTDDKVFNKLRPVLTLSPNWMPNVNTMNAAMMAALFNLPLDIAKQVVFYRKVQGWLSFSDVERLTGRRVDPDAVSVFPSFTLEVKVVSTFKTARDVLNEVITFHTYSDKPFMVLKWEG